MPQKSGTPERDQPDWHVVGDLLYLMLLFFGSLGCDPRGHPTKTVKTRSWCARRQLKRQPAADEKDVDYRPVCCEHAQRTPTGLHHDQRAAIHEHWASQSGPFKGHTCRGVPTTRPSLTEVLMSSTTPVPAAPPKSSGSPGSRLNSTALLAAVDGALLGGLAASTSQRTRS